MTVNTLIEALQKLQGEGLGLSPVLTDAQSPTAFFVEAVQQELLDNPHEKGVFLIVTDGE